MKYISKLKNKVEKKNLIKEIDEDLEELKENIEDEDPQEKTEDVHHDVEEYAKNPLLKKLFERYWNSQMNFADKNDKPFRKLKRRKTFEELSKELKDIKKTTQNEFTKEDLETPHNVAMRDKENEIHNEVS